jgi:signal peptidase I
MGRLALIAFDRPWQIVGLIALVVLIRVIVPRLSVIRSQWRSSLLEFDDSLLIALLIVFCVVRPFVLQAFYIPSGSMLPTLHQGDRILVLKFWYRLSEPRPRDIVVFRAPRAALFGNPAQNPDVNAQKDFIKRLQGTPGDRLRVRDGALYRNGQRQQEPYLESPPAYVWPEDPDTEVVVPPGCYVVMGDNRNNSNDSTKWKLPTVGGEFTDSPWVPEEGLLGKAWLIFWPLDRIRLLN